MCFNHACLHQFVDINPTGWVSAYLFVCKVTYLTSRADVSALLSSSVPCAATVQRFAGSFAYSRTLFEACMSLAVATFDCSCVAFVALIFRERLHKLYVSLEAEKQAADSQLAELRQRLETLQHDQLWQQSRSSSLEATAVGERQKLLT